MYLIKRYILNSANQVITPLYYFSVEKSEKRKGKKVHLLLLNKVVNRYLKSEKEKKKGAPKSFPKFEMDESIGKFCNSLAAFCNHIQCSCDALKQSVDRRPIPLGCFLSLFVSLTTTTTTTSISVMPEFCSFLFCVGVDFGVAGGQILLRRLSCNA